MMTKNRSKLWLWLVPLLLLVAGIVIPRLAWDGLWFDEIYSVINSRGAHYGPTSLEAIWTQVTQNDPSQALGYPYLLAAWGSLVGWTEFALRAASLLGALLAVAVSYELGKRIVSIPVGITTASILAISTYFINYAHELRSYIFVALLAELLLWSYHALLDAKENMPRRPQALFVLSGTALLWLHYYSALLLLAIGFYHLIFVQKDRRWLRITALALGVGLLFLPQIPSFIKGFTAYAPDVVAVASLSAWEIIAAMVYFMGNNLALLMIAALLSGLIAAWRETPRLRMIIIVTLFSVIILIITNEMLGILEPTRLRYVTYLCPLLALWLGAGLVYMGKQLQRFVLPYAASVYRPLLAHLLLLGLPLIWLANGVYANYQPDFNAMIAGDVVPRLRLMSNQLHQQASSHDLLVYYNGSNRQISASYMPLGLEYALTGQAADWIFSSSVFHETNENTRLWARGKMENARRIWYGVNRTLPLNDLHEAFLALVAADFMYCGNVIDEWDISLDLYARSQTFCPTNTHIARFGDSFTLRAYDHSLQAGQLHLDMAWERSAAIPANTFSLGVYIMPQGISDLLAQTDTGFPDEPYTPLSYDLNLSHLPAGTYDIWLAVYEWRSGERLSTANGANLWLLTSITLD
jgi:uncharacterized membrane protein